MAERRSNEAPKPRGRPRKATTTEGRERQMVGLAMDEMERQIREGKASSAVLVHFAKLGTASRELEIAKIEGENRLLDARVAQIASGEEFKALAERAINVFTGYQRGPRHMESDVDGELEVD